MPERVSIHVENAPQSFGHFSQVIKYGNQLHISGQLPIDPQTRRLVSTDITAQAKAVHDHLTAIMQMCAGALSNIMSTRVYLIDLKDHGAFDAVSKEYYYFVPPARTVIQVSGLPFGARVMVDATAELNPVELKTNSLL